MKTWIKELTFVSSVLLSTWFLSGMKPIESIGTLAVILTFCYIQVATRLDEKVSDCVDTEDHRVHCRAWLNRYLVIKESLWCVYFVCLGAWSALVGVAIFILYPLWRRLRSK